MYCNPTPNLFWLLQIYFKKYENSDKMAEYVWKFRMFDLELGPQLEKEKLKEDEYV